MLRQRHGVFMYDEGCCTELCVAFGFKYTISSNNYLLDISCDTCELLSSVQPIRAGDMHSPTTAITTTPMRSFAGSRMH